MTGVNQEFQAPIKGGVAARDIHHEAPRTSIQIGAIHGGQNIIGHTGDIHLYSAQMLWHRSSKELAGELERCLGKLRQLRKERFINVPFFWLLAGVFGSAVLLASGVWLKYLGSVWPFVWMIGSVMVPMLWLTAIHRRKDKMIAHYSRRVEIIDTILVDRK